jgi:hypothetical protein
MICMLQPHGNDHWSHYSITFFIGSTRFGTIGCPLFRLVCRSRGFSLFRFALQVSMQGCWMSPFARVARFSSLAFPRQMPLSKASKAESFRFCKFFPRFECRLRNNIKFWKKIGTSNFILSVISEGYRLPFIQTPPCRDISNNKSAFAHSNFPNEAINELNWIDLMITDFVTPKG